MLPLDTRPAATDVQREWSRVLWWWIRLVTVMQLSTPLMLIACGVGWLDVRESVLIVYIAVNGSTSILTAVGGLVLKPFNAFR